MEIWRLDGPWPGTLAVCARPRAGWFLEDDLRKLHREGFRVLVSALTPQEVVKSELERVPELCEAAGLEFAHFPVGNLQVAVADLAAPLLEAWHGRLAAGESVAIHCWASVGRGPTLAAALLILGGLEPADAWAQIEAARGRQVPDTNEQREWAAAFATRRTVTGV